MKDGTSVRKYLMKTYVNLNENFNSSLHDCDSQDIERQCRLQKKKKNNNAWNSVNINLREQCNVVGLGKILFIIIVSMSYVDDRS